MPPPQPLYFPRPCNYPKADFASAPAQHHSQRNTENSKNIMTVFLKTSGDLKVMVAIVNKELDSQVSLV